MQRNFALIEENNKMGKTRDLFKIIRDTTGTFQAKMGSIKDRNGLDLTEAEEVAGIHRRTMDRGSSHCIGDRNQDHPQEKEMQKSTSVA